jgi:N-acetylated-alpha-linked acidic dipeptidase
MTRRSGLLVGALCGIAVAWLVATGALQRATPGPFGFAARSASAHRALERQFLAQPDADRIRDLHRLLTREPHPAGSPRARELAQWTAEQFQAAGLVDVEIVRHDVLLPYPLDVQIEMVHPRFFRASMREAPIAGDPDTQIDPAELLTPYHAYSASGDVTADVVYAGEGLPADYDWLESQDVDVRGRLVLVRHSAPYTYRGFKVLTAERRGAAGILIFSDPAVAGSARGPAYPDGPWAPDTLIERGAVAYDFLVPGDPLTPGWASTDDAARVPIEEAPSLPRIMSAPLSAADVAPILGALEGPVAPERWQGGLSFTYHLGPGPARVRLRVRTDNGMRPVWTVTGMLRGSVWPDELVIVGNHRDAWVYGGVDPSSGSAALVELAHAFGVLVAGGWQPKRSVLLASWDAEEFALISSTEWAEQHADWLRERVVAYLNVDSAASGSRFAAAAVPSLTRLVTEVAHTVRDPEAGIPLAAVLRDERRAEGMAARQEIVDDRIGGGSDYTVFLNHLGIPVADLGFRGPYGVYHSLYDTHMFVARIADPGFRYHRALVQAWGLMALRLAEADAVPLDVDATSRALLAFITAAGQRLPSGAGDVLADARAATRELAAAADRFSRARDEALARGDGVKLARVNRTAIQFERAFLDPVGLPGRPWYRHLVHAPAFTYHPQILPGIVAAEQSGDHRQLGVEAARLAAAIRRAAASLDAAVLLPADGSARTP